MGFPADQIWMENAVHTLRKVERKRQLAVALHDSTVSDFERDYAALKKDRFSSAFTYARSRLHPRLESYLREVPRGSRILDVGCGPGEQIKMYQGLGLDPVGVEPAPHMREVAQCANPGVPILQGTVLDLPLPDDSFDVVVAIEVLRYLDRTDWNQAFTEILRVLRPGGRLLVTMRNRYSLDGFFLYERLRKLCLNALGREPSAHHEFTTPAEVRRELRALGAQDLSCLGSTFGPLILAYKIFPKWAGRIARSLETVDDALCDREWYAPFAAQLVVFARRARLSAT
jgi:SAM-dependent methyltransferase